MPPGHRTPARSTPSALRVLGALAFLLLAVAAPSPAIDDYYVASPAAGAIVEGPTSIVATVVAGPVEEVTLVQVSLLRGGVEFGPVRNLAHVDGPRQDGTSTWATPLDPLRSWAAGGGAMPNGAYRVQVRVHSTVQGVQQEPTPWKGHGVVFDVAPPPVHARVRPVQEQPPAVEVAWDRSSLPDFTRYTVERSRDGGAYVVVGELQAQSATSHVDAPESDGRYAYRVVVHRTGGRGTERSAPSNTSTVVFGTPPPQGQQEPAQPSETPAPAPQDGGTETSAGGAPSEGGSGQPNTLGVHRRVGTMTAPATVAPVPPEIAAVDTIAPQAAPPSARNRVFDPTLYDVPRRPAETITERRVTQVPGTGVAEHRPIAIYGREFDQQRVLPMLAGSLILIATALHLRRFLAA